jgi:hypothetical protein
MSNGGVVSIRVEGFSVIIAEGRIAIEQTKTPTVNAAPKVESPGVAVDERPPQLGQGDIAERLRGKGHHPNGAVDSTLREDLGSENSESSAESANIVSHTDATTSENSELAIGKTEQASSQTKPVWTADEVEKLKALYPLTQPPRSPRRWGEALIP